MSLTHYEALVSRLPGKYRKEIAKTCGCSEDLVYKVLTEQRIDHNGIIDAAYALVDSIEKSKKQQEEAKQKLIKSNKN